MNDPSPGQLELRVERVAFLFDALDPFPIPSRDLAKTAEDFIVSWARDFPDETALCILIHLPATEAARADAAALGDAFARHFTYRAERARGDLQELFRFGRMALMVGLAVLGSCIVAARFAAGLAADEYLRRFLGEGLVIVGWVANWRPIEIFLYDWLPLAQRRRLYRRLAAAPVILKPLEPQKDRDSA